MVNLTISLIGANGDTIQLDNNSDYILTTGLSGFGIPATEVRIDPSAGNGGTWRHTKRGVRDIDLPIVILGDTRDEVEAKLRRLSRLIQDREGPTRIVASYSNGDELYLEAHYTGGAETQFGSDASGHYCKWVLAMQAPQPFWQSTSTQSFTLTSGVTGRGLLPQLTKMKVSSSQTLGTVNVNSLADVDVYPTWTITGPVGTLLVDNGIQSFTLDGAVLAGETVTIDTEAGTVTDQNGLNRYDLLGPAPKMFPFAPGNSVISISGTDTTSGTYIRCSYALRYEVIH